MATPHLEKLKATLENEKLPTADKPRVEEAIERYHDWIEAMSQVSGSPEDTLEQLVSLMNDYKRSIDLDLIFDSQEDFLYRQKGQLKIDNSIIEEFLPWLLRSPVCTAVPGHFRTGPTTCFAAVYFSSTIRDNQVGAGIQIRTKDQDFAISRPLYLKASQDANFAEAQQLEVNVGYIATEIKTNLDKTMFQEACATARDLRVAVPGARYFLMCEWLDMSPVSTAQTDIAEVLILRKAKRLGSNVRQPFSTAAGRRHHRSTFKAYLDAHPFNPIVFQRWVDKIVASLSDTAPVESSALENGYF